MSDNLKVDLQEHVALIEITRPPNNFLDLTLVVSIIDALDELAACQCRAVVLASTGEHFCAGADLAARRRKEGPNLADLIVRLIEQPIPIVAAVQGAAVGAGFGLAMIADFRIATHKARFVANFARLGFHHGWGLSATLPCVAGQQAAIEILYTGRRIDATEAFRMGIADRLVEDARAEALSLAGEIAESAPLAVRSIRETMRARLVTDVRGSLDNERAQQEWLWRTKDCREGLAAMAERRRPLFKGE